MSSLETSEVSAGNLRSTGVGSNQGSIFNLTDTENNQSTQEHARLQFISRLGSAAISVARKAAAAASPRNVLDSVATLKSNNKVRRTATFAILAVATASVLYASQEDGMDIWGDRAKPIPQAEIDSEKSRLSAEIWNSLSATEAFTIQYARPNSGPVHINGYEQSPVIKKEAKGNGILGLYTGTESVRLAIQGGNCLHNKAYALSGIISPAELVRTSESEYTLITANGSSYGFKREESGKFSPADDDAANMLEDNGCPA